jgi:putative spermidine/putrescine transport system permease protein
LLWRSVDNPEVVGSLPRTVEAIAAWDGRGLPEESVYRALSEDLLEARQNQSLGDLSKRLNMEQAGFRSLMTKTARALPFKELPTSYKEALETFDERWGDPAYWQVIRRNDSALTPYYLLAALDHRIDDMGELAPVSPDQAVYLDIFARTFWMGLVITAICLVLAYPLAYLLANLPARKSNLLMIMVLLPFWTSILVRVAAWIVLLQSSGLINGALLKMGLIDEPLRILNTDLAVYIGVVYSYLPFMILPLYANLVKHDLSLLEAASDLGARNLTSFWKITVPLSKNGIIAGCMLVFIPVVGEFVIPELLGGPETLMIGKVLWQEFFNNRDWPVASALAVVMLAILLVPIILFNRNQTKELEGKL